MKTAVLWVATPCNMLLLTFRRSELRLFSGQRIEVIRSSKTTRRHRSENQSTSSPPRKSQISQVSKNFKESEIWVVWRLWRYGVCDASYKTTRRHNQKTIINVGIIAYGLNLPLKTEQNHQTFGQRSLRSEIRTTNLQPNELNKQLYLYDMLHIPPPTVTLPKWSLHRYIRHTFLLFILLIMRATCPVYFISLLSFIKEKVSLWDHIPLYVCPYYQLLN